MQQKTVHVKVADEYVSYPDCFTLRRFRVYGLDDAYEVEDAINEIRKNAENDGLDLNLIGVKNNSTGEILYV